MKAFKMFVLVALLFGAFPAMSGACDGLFNRSFDRFDQRRSKSVFGFGVVKARPVARVVVTLPVAVAKTVAKPLQAPALKCANGTCKIK